MIWAKLPILSGLFPPLPCWTLNPAGGLSNSFIQILHKHSLSTDHGSALGTTEAALNKIGPKISALKLTFYWESRQISICPVGEVCGDRWGVGVGMGRSARANVVVYRLEVVNRSSLREEGAKLWGWLEDDRGNGLCKGPEVGPIWDSETSMAGAE